MARRFTDQLREDCARAVMRSAGFQCEPGMSLLTEAEAGNPRVAGWVADADRVLAVVYPRSAKRKASR